MYVGDLIQQGDSPVPRGGAARSTRPYALQVPSAAHHALPASGRSSAVHVSLCRCASCVNGLNDPDSGGG
jgi:hypothetical protein